MLMRDPAPFLWAETTNVSLCLMSRVRYVEGRRGSTDHCDSSPCSVDSFTAASLRLVHQILHPLNGVFPSLADS